MYEESMRKRICNDETVLALICKQNWREKAARPRLRFAVSTGVG